MNPELQQAIEAILQFHTGDYNRYRRLPHSISLQEALQRLQKEKQNSEVPS